jgi:hypothetical protein
LPCHPYEGPQAQVNQQGDKSGDAEDDQKSQTRSSRCMNCFVSLSCSNAPKLRGSLANRNLKGDARRFSLWSGARPENLMAAEVVLSILA